jgi:quercetin dioxygenase-like cupin family protein
MHRSRTISVTVLFAVLLALSSVLILQAQQVGEIKRNVLTKQDASIPGYEGVVAQVEFAPGAREAKHTHPGDVFAYLQEGTIVLDVEGKPTTTVKAGEVFFIPAGKVHWGENTGKTPAKALVTFVVEKGKPLSSPAK